MEALHLNLRDEFIRHRKIGIMFNLFRLRHLALDIYEKVATKRIVSA